VIPGRRPIRLGGYGVDVSAMSFELHEWDIQALCCGAGSVRVMQVHSCVRALPHRDHRLGGVALQQRDMPVTLSRTDTGTGPAGILLTRRMMSSPAPTELARDFRATAYAATGA